MTAVDDRAVVQENVEREALKILLFSNLDLVPNTTSEESIPELKDLDELPELTDLTNLDSFSIVLLVLALEDTYGIALLDDMSGFTGTTFADLGDFIYDRLPKPQAQQDSSLSAT
ncbi:hypothetical protein HII36_07430 [Nonomuraea sp. NN258]|uniref:hypothetical protein n=1 Tax=Nonomuraea antri TaxID=2730852 RepID=UPI0015689D90|nr:hypothetical protein [Nonomuraea antri]NRQ31673.1 hypothetical protein [Nonomuraea antri]